MGTTTGLGHLPASISNLWAETLNCDTEEQFFWHVTEVYHSCFLR